MVAERVVPSGQAEEQPWAWRPSLALEQRAGAEFAELMASPVYYGFGVPRGDGHSVLVVPGFMGSDTYLTVLAGWLRRIGYRPAQSGIALNAGSAVRNLRQVEKRAEALASPDRRITIIGHSLGGVFARIIAVMRPELVERVITLGSPLTGNPRESAHPMVRALAEVMMREAGSDSEEAEAMARLAEPLPPDVYLTSIYTKEDAVVHWRSCLDQDPQSECFEVRGTHVGLAWNAAVYRILGRALLS